MTTLRQAAEQALEALELPSLKTQQMLQQRDEAITTLRIALEQQQAEPVVNQTGETNGRHDEFRSDLYGIMAVGRDTSRAISGEKPASLTGHCKEKAKPGGCQLHNLQCGYPACDRPVTPPQQQAEPVCEVIDGRGEVDWISFVPPAKTSLYTAPPQRKPLTQTEVVEGFCKQPHDVQFVSVFNAGVRFAEAAHGIKGEA